MSDLNNLISIWKEDLKHKEDKKMILVAKTNWLESIKLEGQIIELRNCISDLQDMKR